MRWRFRTLLVAVVAALACLGASLVPSLLPQSRSVLVSAGMLPATPAPASFVYLPLTARNWDVDVYVLPNHSSYVDEFYNLHIVGEVANNTYNNLRFVKVVAHLFHSTGEPVAAEFTYTYLDNVPAFTKTCFHSLLPAPANWSYYTFEKPTYSSDGGPLPNLAVFNESGGYNPAYRWYKIIGFVRNDEGTTVRHVSPVGTLYNSSGTVVGCDDAYVNPIHLEPSQAGSFEMASFGSHFASVTSYRLQVDGKVQ